MKNSKKSKYTPPKKRAKKRKRPESLEKSNLKKVYKKVTKNQEKS